MADNTFEIVIGICGPRGDWRAKLAETMLHCHTRTLDSLLALIDSQKLPMSRTACKQAYRYTHRWANYHRERSTAAPDFVRVVCAIAENIDPVQLFTTLMANESYLTQRFFKVSSVQELG